MNDLPRGAARRHYLHVANSRYLVTPPSFTGALSPAVGEPSGRGQRLAQGFLVDDHRIETLEPDARVGGRELPIHSGRTLVTRLSPGRDFTRQKTLRPQPTGQALPAEHTQLDLGHV